MKHHALLVMTLVAVGAGASCSDDDSGDGMPAMGGSGGGTSGAAGLAGMSGGPGMSGAAGTGGSGGSTGSGGTGGNTVQPTPALPEDAPTVSCPTEISGALAVGDAIQTGRHSRIAPVSACGMQKGYAGNAADPTNPHLFDVYRFANPGAAPVCFNFTLTYGGSPGVEVDAGADAANTGDDAGADAEAVDAGDAPVVAAPAKYMTAYGTFFPTNLSLEFRGDTGDILTSPQTMSITVPAGETIDVVVYAIDVAPAGAGAYALSCSTQ